jgi:hypothetical protein
MSRWARSIYSATLNQKQTNMTTRTVDEKIVFAFLEKQKKAVLLDYLRAAFEEMNARQRRVVFAGAVRRPSTSCVDGGRLRKEIDEFRRDSLAGNYYAPFNVNSKNFMEVPEETHEWCDRFARLVAEVCKLTANGEHAQAVTCFAPLYELLDALDFGKEIIFADEAGSWMIPADEKKWLKAYLTSLAATATPEGFTAVALPMIARDSSQSFASRAYASACAAANPQQKAQLQADVKRQKIRTARDVLTPGRRGISKS